MASWLADQLKAYQAQTGVNVTATLKEAQSVLADFRQAAETGSPPDAQSFWSGRGLYDGIWREHLADLESLFPQDFLARNAARAKRL